MSKGDGRDSELSLRGKGSLIGLGSLLVLGLIAFGAESYSLAIISIIMFFGLIIPVVKHMPDDDLEVLANDYESGIEDTYQKPNNEKLNSDKNIQVCRECKQEVPQSVKRCPHCGWKPKKRGGLWWATTAVMSLNPIGWAMGAKGLSDKMKASKGVSEIIEDRDSEGTKFGNNKNSPDQVNDGNNEVFDKISRLKELEQNGTITKEEFEEKKKDLLRRI